MATTIPGGTTGVQSSLSEWAGPYVTNMLGQAQALSSMPYQVYQGPMTAASSPLQNQAFQGISSLGVPNAVGQAAQTAGNVANAAGQLGYSPTQFQNTFAAPQAFQTGNFQNQYQPGQQYQAGTFNAGYQAPTPYQSTTDFSNTFQAGAAYNPNQFNTGIFNTQAAQQYMNPYLQTALNPQLDELRRQAQITRTGDAARLAQAGAYGGSRQAIMESELNRNLMNKQADVTAQGYNTAYDKAGQMFTSDQARALQAQQLGEQSRQFGAQLGSTERELMARYGMSAQQAREAASQFGYGQQMSAADAAARYGLQAQQMGEQSRQFGFGQDATARELQARYGLSADQAREASRQFGAQQGMQAAQLGAQYGMDAQRAAEASRQFGAQYGLSALAQQLAGAQAQGQLGLEGLKAQQGIYNQMAQAGGTQRDIEQQGITADYNEFLQQRDYPMKMLQFQQSMLQGLPIGAQNYTQQQPSSLQQLFGTTGGLMELYNKLFPSTTTKSSG